MVAPEYGAQSDLRAPLGKPNRYNAMSVRIGGTAAGALAVLLLSLVPAASADWTTYHGNAGRSGVDTSSTGSLPFSAAWTSPMLAGDIYGQPLVHNGLVVVATESNDVYALNESTGQVVWHRNVGTPVDASALPCGNIGPTVGITSTPVIDPATDRVFVVADTWDGSHASSIRHLLFGFNVSSGSGIGGLPLPIDPPTSDHSALLQRTALALDGGKVIIGYGGNDGDCGTYHGWLVAAPETGGALQTFAVSPTSGGGAVWGAGDGAAVDSSGNIWAATGNGFGAPYEYQESVLRLNSDLGLIDHWAPSNWQALDNNDTDLGSSDPLLLPGGLAFQIGKEGVGYLLSMSHLGGTGAAPAYQAQVCGASFGGNVYYSGVIYVTCTDGLYALSLNTSTRTFAPVASWQVPSGANGPPIVAGGLVWATDYSDSPNTLYGLNPQTGQPVVTRSTAHMVHFTSPSASDGKLFLATGHTVEAYRIANPVSSSTQQPPPATGTCGCAGARCRIRLVLARPRHGRITRARVYLGKHLLANKRGHRLRRIWFTSPSHRRTFSVRVIERTSTHRRLSFKVSYRDCRRVKPSRHRHR
jgi:outer membrane protein assembly factor BamB